MTAASTYCALAFLDPLLRRAALVVEGDDPNAIAPAVTEYQPSDAQIGYFLARFVQNTRALSVDPIVVRQAWLDAYDQITSHGKPVLDDCCRTRRSAQTEQRALFDHHTPDGLRLCGHS
jgi:type IV secretory pathway TrbF-like protein